MEIIELMFGGFWVFIGFWILIGLIFTFLFKCWNRVFRHMNIRKHGWPPEHLDGDGDFKTKEKEVK